MSPRRRIKLLKNGPNQVALIPREFELPGEDAIIRKVGEKLIIEPVRPPALLAALASLPPTYDELPEIPDPPPAPVEL